MNVGGEVNNCPYGSSLHWLMVWRSGWRVGFEQRS